MKYIKRIRGLATALAAVNLLSCNSPDLVPEAPFTLEYSTIDGDTIKTQKIKNFLEGYNEYKNAFAVISFQDTVITYKEPKLPPLPSREPKLDKIKNTKDEELKGKPVKMLVLGGNLSSGLRDGGYFNEGILTSYPNLLARQMRLESFVNPLFNKENYNGLGRHIPAPPYMNVSGGPFTKFLKASNNLAYTGVKNRLFTGLEPFKGEVDNMTFPFMPIRNGLSGHASNSIADGQAFGRLLSFGERDSRKSFLEEIQTKKFDFFVFEFGNDEVLKRITSSGDRGSSPILSHLDYIEKPEIPEYQRLVIVPAEIRMMREAFIPSGAKGVLMNIPNWLSIPYFVDSELIRAALIDKTEEIEELNSFLRNRTFKATAAIDSILSPQVSYILKPSIDKKHPVVFPIDFLWTFANPGESIEDIIFIYNEMVSRMAKHYSLPIADVKGLYDKVNQKDGFIDNFGKKINQENFYSGDKIYPSPLGHALICNEIIKAMNTHYGLDIQQINTRELY